MVLSGLDPHASLFDVGKKKIVYRNSTGKKEQIKSK